MTSETTLVLFGAGGDLSSRLLLPALGSLLVAQPERRVTLVGADRQDGTDADLRRTVEASFASSDASAAADRVQVRYRRTDITDAADLRALLSDVPDADGLYFAVPPAVTAAACEALEADMLPAGVMLALEKPFGTDEASARALNERLAELVPEEQVFRIDHFLGRSSVLNLLGVRFANRRLEATWSAEHIAEVSVVYDEKLGLEGRAGYYDRAGALVDMIQSHLLQVLAILGMECPPSLDAEPFRETKSAVLRAVHVRGDDPVAASRRARYAAGEIEDTARVGYLDEPDVDPANDTETLAEVVFEIRTPRWEGVPFRLRSGKALGARFAEIAVVFRPPEHVPEGFVGRADPEIIRFTLGPDRMSWEINMNGAADPLDLERETLVTAFGAGDLPPYGEILEGILDHDPMLAVRGDAAEECWRIVAPVLEAWRAGKVPLEEYPAGSLGPQGWPARV
ncbi:glucose-6-phosphate dehydrogenase [Microbacterium pseudoresistens]|uniref:Glucose-6-phosphate 1-dehydrogenase n=1 Tax=Microbacterium pseudoresistens TaxID=640634 RepID=A0A7Y9EVP5_9MICO|nr:glucose-6-phosphate dehydrogenase [Microbacterium pseudoresistens]NYD54664.1 glucose-6-phosphate 1-dehydrogenase [Microbacterium pseudoresistens]